MHLKHYPGCSQTLQACGFGDGNTKSWRLYLYNTHLESHLFVSKIAFYIFTIQFGAIEDPPKLFIFQVKFK